jgi:DNA-binding transcriptional MerR regulator
VKTLKTSEAAALLSVSPNTLRVWERRFGFPVPQRSPGKHRLYTHAEILALRDALQEGMGISSAISVARDTFGAEVQALFTRLSAFCTEDADEVMERTLAMRTIERSVEDVLLPALSRIHTRKGVGSPTSVFAMNWACDWLMRVRRATAPPGKGRWVLIGDASTPLLDPMRPYTVALQLFCARAGVTTLSIPLCASVRVPEAVGIVEPDAVVIAGCQTLSPDVVSWVNTVRAVSGPIPVLLYHHEEQQRAARLGTPILPASPLAARRQLVEVLAGEPAPPRKEVEAKRPQEDCA